MRNLKRALSLTLASVMLLGMMVVGSSAAAGYDDVSETDNVEAIEVVQAVEVMVGDENGNFRPGDSVSRAEMAVVMGKLLNLDYNYYSATCPFTDVSGVYDWAKGWVGAAAANGIVSGRGEGIYDPGATVTAVEAASMMMRALGYFRYSNDYSDGFEVSTVRLGTTIGIFDGVGSSATAPMTRNQVAQMVLNALQTGVVEPDGRTINLTTPDGQVYTGKVNYVNITSDKAFARAIGRVEATSVGSQNDGYIVELGERLYDGKLKLDDKAIDDFGRPSRKWELDGKEVGTYIKKELIREEYTAKVTGRTLHDLLGTATLRDYNLDVYIDGVDDPTIATAPLFDKNALVRANDVAVGGTGNGVLTQVFVDPDDGPGRITIAVINTYLAIADEDYDERTADVDVTVYGIDEFNSTKEYVKNADNDDGSSTTPNQKESFKLEEEYFPEVVDVKDGDSFLVTVAKGEIQTIAKPEILSGVEITTFKTGGYVITGGQQYDFASAAEYECESLYHYTYDSVVNLKDITYNVYLDKYGYAIAVEEVERVNNYLFITGLDTNANNRYSVRADASAIFLDGTMDSIKINMKDMDAATYAALTSGTEGESLINKWFTYTVDDNDVYDVVLVGNAAAIDNPSIKARSAQYRTYNKANSPADGVDEIGPESIALRGDANGQPFYSVYGDDESIYITAELDRIEDAGGRKVNVIGGVDNVVTNIDKASIDIWTEVAAKAAETPAGGAAADLSAYGAYTLFDKDGDVIAAVVVGEDSGAVTNLVYTHKDEIESETNNTTSSSRASVKGTYTWTRKVISEGEEVLLTEVGSGLSVLKSMQPYTWYEVKFNAKGEVKKVAVAGDASGKGLVDSNPAKRNEDRYVNNIEELNDATKENRTVLFEVGRYNGETRTVAGTDITWEGYNGSADKLNLVEINPKVDNHTFYVKTDTNTGVHQGFRVSDDVKTVLVQRNNNKWDTTYESGYGRLEKVVDKLHARDEITYKDIVDHYRYEVSAVMENGKAVVVVIRDLNGAGADASYTGKSVITFSERDYPISGDNRFIFDVNGKELVYPTDFKYEGSGMWSFTVDNGAAVGVFGRGNVGFGNVDGSVNLYQYNNGSGTVWATGNVNATRNTLSFTAVASGTLPSNLVSAGASEGTWKLTLNHANLIDSALARVIYDDGNGWQSATESINPDASKEIYEIPKGAEVIVELAADTNLPNTGTYVADGVVIDINKTAKQMKFTMEKNLILTAVPSTAVIKVTVANGVTVTGWNTAASGAGTAVTPIVDNSTSGVTVYAVPDDTYGTIAVTETGASLINVADDTTKTSTAGSTGEVQFTDNAWLYPAYKVDGANVTFDIDGTTHNDVSVGATVYVAKNSVLKDVKATTGSYIISGNDKVATSNYTAPTAGITLTSDMKLTGATRLVVGTGVKTTVDSVVRNAGTYYVVTTEATSSTAVVDATYGTAVINTGANGNLVSAAAAYSDGAIGGTNVTLSAAVKVTYVTADADEVKYVGSAGMSGITSGTSGTNTEFFILPNSTISVKVATTGESVAVDGATDAVLSTDATLTQGDYTGIELGVKDTTLTIS